MKILISDKIEAICPQLFQEAGFEVDQKTDLTPEQLAEVIGGYDGLVVRSATKVTADTLKNKGQLKIIGRAGAGVDTIDVPAATAAKVVVMNTPGQNSNAAAELAVAMMFALARPIVQACTTLKACKWEKKNLGGIELGGKTLGVIGYGAIGRRVGKMGQGLGMNVIAYDPQLSADQLKAEGAKAVALDELIKTADFITLHIPKTKDTANLFNLETLKKMKKGSFLVNCARGGLVDEEALYTVLKEGHLAGAAMDVFVNEPLGESKLLELPNFIGSPHIGASTEEAQLNVAVAVAKQMIDYLKNGNLVGGVNA